MTKKNLLLIDTSYLIFYRFHALKIWFSIAKPEISLETEDISTIPEFMEMYEKTFLQTIEKISKKHKITFKETIFVRDCSGIDIWRKQLYPEYKGTRDYSNFNGKQLFKWTYENLLPKYAASQTIQFDNLEADDTIAFIVKYLNKYNPETFVTIITNDNDYLQLLKYQNIQILNLKGDNLKDRSIGTPRADLMKKIIMGDPSDNIPKIFKKCGIKTLEKYLENQELLDVAFKQEPDAKRQYKFNEVLIDFDKIPAIFLESVLSWCNQNLK
jgi:5'-3' exonuclease